MAITRTTKAVAKRIDLGYFKRWHALRSMRKVLAWAASLVTIVALGIYTQETRSRGTLGIYNPGPVSRAHANFEQKCWYCHDANSKGGFFKTVSDTACLKCHDGALHDSHQKTMIAVDKNHHALTDLKGQHMVAADCRSCHVEHRGHEALAATSDEHCTVCHANLNQHMTGGPTKLKADVTTFAVEDHPAFGRELTKDGKGHGPLVDSVTKLKFNHKTHLDPKGKVPAIANAEHNCTLCHNVGIVPVSATQYEEQVKANPLRKRPPFPTADEQQFVGQEKMDKAPVPLFTSNAADRRFMTPVSYERSCSGCHQIKLNDDVPLPHARLEIVRAELDALPQILAQKIAADPDKEKKLNVTTTEGNGPKKKTVTKKVTEAEWVDATVKKIYASVSDDSGDKYGTLLQGAGASPSGDMDPGLLEYYVVNRASDSCSRCHELEGNLPAVYAKKMATPSTQPVAEPVMLEQTKPTGFSQTPRRWFADSHFDHDAHRNMECVACHDKAVTSTQTTDVLMPTIEDCVQCHRPAGWGERSVGSDCVMCHNFHDRTHERSMDGMELLKGEEKTGAGPIAKGP